MRPIVGALTLASLLSACGQPPPYVAPTAPPTPTSVAATAVAALQTGPAATQVAVAAATSVTASTMRISDASFDPENVANTAVTVANMGQAPVDLGGWTLLVANYRVELPATKYMTVAPGNALIVHLSSSATPTSGQNVYVGEGALQSTPRVDADRIVLLDPQRQVASVYPAP